MRKEGVILLVTLLFLSTNTLAQTPGQSDIETTVHVKGCELANGETVLKGACSKDGKFYCDNNEELQNTLLETNACALGKTTYTTGAEQCCPSGYLCNENGDMTCGLRLTPCSEYATQNDCNTNTCFWIDDGTEQFCVDKPTDYSCGVYQTQDACTQDIFNLGQNGLGTEGCGQFFEHNEGTTDDGTYIISPSSCYCTWTLDAAGNYCGLTYTATPHVFLEQIDKGICNLDYTSEPCIDGIQEVRWTHIFNELPVGAFQDKTALATTIACTDGTKTRICGVETITLPGISIYGILATITLLGIYYTRKKE